MKYHSFFSFISFLFLLNSCASIPVATMEPINTPTTFNWGREVVTFKENGLTLQVTYLRSTDDQYIFEVEAQNVSGSPKLVSPQNFYYQLMWSDSLAPQDNLYPAINPEIQLLEINKSVARELAAEKNSYLFEFIAMITNTALDIATINEEKTEEEKEEEEARRQQRRDNFELKQLERELTFQSLNSERAYWENNMLRKTHIPHGHSIKGQVIFNRLNNKHPFLKFTFQAGNETFSVVYKQKLTHPRDPSY